jgi:hypothetical protein
MKYIIYKITKKKEVILLMLDDGFYNYPLLLFGMQTGKFPFFFLICPLDLIN